MPPEVDPAAEPKKTNVYQFIGERPKADDEILPGGNRVLPPQTDFTADVIGSTWRPTADDAEVKVAKVEKGVEAAPKKGDVVLARETEAMYSMPRIMSDYRGAISAADQIDQQDISKRTSANLLQLKELDAKIASGQVQGDQLVQLKAQQSALQTAQAKLNVDYFAPATTRANFGMAMIASGQEMLVAFGERMLKEAAQLRPEIMNNPHFAKNVENARILGEKNRKLMNEGTEGNPYQFSGDGVKPGQIPPFKPIVPGQPSRGPNGEIIPGNNNPGFVPVPGNVRPPAIIEQPGAPKIPGFVRGPETPDHARKDRPTPPKPVVQGSDSPAEGKKEKEDDKKGPELFKTVSVAIAAALLAYKGYQYLKDGKLEKIKNAGNEDLAKNPENIAKLKAAIEAEGKDFAKDTRVKAAELKEGPDAGKMEVTKADGTKETLTTEDFAKRYKETATKGDFVEKVPAQIKVGQLPDFGPLSEELGLGKQAERKMWVTVENGEVKIRTDKEFKQTFREPSAEDRAEWEKARVEKLTPEERAAEEEAKRVAEEAKKAEEARLEKLTPEERAAEEEAKRVAEEAKKAEEARLEKLTPEERAAEEAKRVEEAAKKAEEARLEKLTPEERAAEEAKRVEEAAKKAEEARLEKLTPEERAAEEAKRAEGAKPTPEEVKPAPEGAKPTPEEVKPAPEGTKPTPEEVKPAPEGAKPTPEEIKPTPEVPVERFKPVAGAEILAGVKVGQTVKVGENSWTAVGKVNDSVIVKNDGQVKMGTRGQPFEPANYNQVEIAGESGKFYHSKTNGKIYKFQGIEGAPGKGLLYVMNGIEAKSVNTPVVRAMQKGAAVEEAKPLPEKVDEKSVEKPVEKPVDAPTPEAAKPVVEEAKSPISAEKLKLFVDRVEKGLPAEGFLPELQTRSKEFFGQEGNSDFQDAVKRTKLVQSETLKPGESMLVLKHGDQVFTSTAFEDGKFVTADGQKIDVKDCRIEIQLGKGTTPEKAVSETLLMFNNINDQTTPGKRSGSSDETAKRVAVEAKLAETLEIARGKIAAPGTTASEATDLAVKLGSFEFEGKTVEVALGLKSIIINGEARPADQLVEATLEKAKERLAAAKDDAQREEINREIAELKALHQDVKAGKPIELAKMNETIASNLKHDVEALKAPRGAGGGKPGVIERAGGAGGRAGAYLMVTAFVAGLVLSEAKPAYGAQPRQTTFTPR